MTYGKPRLMAMRRPLSLRSRTASGVLVSSSRLPTPVQLPQSTYTAMRWQRRIQPQSGCAPEPKVRKRKAPDKPLI